MFASEIRRPDWAFRIPKGELRGKEAFVRAGLSLFELSAPIIRKRDIITPTTRKAKPLSYVLTQSLLHVNLVDMAN